MHITRQQTRVAVEGSGSTARALLAPAVLFMVVAVAAPLGASTARGEEPEVLARVNGEPVTRGEVQRLLIDPTMRRRLQQGLGIQDPDGKELKRLVLQKLIERRLLLQEAGRRNFTVTEQDLNRDIAKFRRRLKSPGRYAAWMKARGLDEKSLREAIRTTLLATRVQAALVKDVRVTQEEIQAYYARGDEFRIAEEPERRPARTRSLAEARPEIEQRLLAAKKQEVFQAWLRQQKEQSKIEVFLQSTESDSAIGSEVLDSPPDGNRIEPLSAAELDEGFHH